jgi:hypothetical protein
MSESTTNGRRLRPTRRDLVSNALLGIVAIPAAYAVGMRQRQEAPITQLDMEPMAWARKMPPTPSFPATIDAYAKYDPQKICDPTAKPGVVDLKNIVLATYGNRAWSIGRTCTSSTSEHYDGRAVDVAFNAASDSSRKLANDFFYWLLRTDRHGNRNALARRFGVMYAIWNRKIWRAYRPSEGWLPYSGTSDPHTSHFHISFSWAGARRQTTWWTLQ